MQDAEQKHCQRRGVRRAVTRCSELQWSHLSAHDEQADRQDVQALGQIQTDAHADAQNVTCTKGGRCSEVLTHLFLAGTGQKDDTGPPSNVFGAEGEDSRPSDLRRGSMHHCCSQMTRTDYQTQVSKQ